MCSYIAIIQMKDKSLPTFAPTYSVDAVIDGGAIPSDDLSEKEYDFLELQDAGRSERDDTRHWVDAEGAHERRCSYSEVGFYMHDGCPPVMDLATDPASQEMLMEEMVIIISGVPEQVRRTGLLWDYLFNPFPGFFISSFTLFFLGCGPAILPNVLRDMREEIKYEGGKGNSKTEMEVRRLLGERMAKLANDSHEHLTATTAQMVMWPMAMTGMSFVMTAPTGTGKTLGYIVPVIFNVFKCHRAIAKDGEGPCALILTSTRELATQISLTVEGICEIGDAANVKGGKGPLEALQVLLCMGGRPKSMDLSCLKRKSVDIMIASPGRLCDLLFDQPRPSPVDLPRMNFVRRVVMWIVDEFDMLCGEDGMVEMLLAVRACMHPRTQTILASATLPPNLPRGSDWYKQLFKSDDPAFVQAGKLDTLSDDLHLAFEVHEANQIPKRLIDILKEYDEGRGFDGKKHTKQCLIFGRSKEWNANLHELLAKHNVDVGIIGGRSHDAFCRSAEFHNFCKGDRYVLIATDVLHRGVDVPNCLLVIQAGLPSCGDDSYRPFLHRCGRTARGGKLGTVLALVEHEYVASKNAKVIRECLRQHHDTSMFPGFDRFEERMGIGAPHNDARWWVDPAPEYFKSSSNYARIFNAEMPKPGEWAVGWGAPATA